jgi:group I intron endonuclease
MIFIYAYENIINGKIYIGQTDDLVRRDRAHTKWPDNSMYIDRAITKYGRENFELHTVSIVDTQEEADKEEIYWISEMRRLLGNKAIYNTANGGGAPMRGRKHTETTKKRMSKSAMGKVGANIGKTFNDEWKLAMSKSQIGKSHISMRKFSDEIEREICKLYAEINVPIHLIANQFDCQEATISRILQRNNININAPGRRNMFTDEQEKMICKLYYTDNINKNQLAKQFNCSIRTIKNILVRNNFSIK